MPESLEGNIVEVINQEVACYANYSSACVDTNYNKHGSYRELEALFNKHRSSIISSGVYVMPKYWSQHVVEAVKDLLIINERIRFVDVRERNSKLILNLHYPNGYDRRIHFRVYEIKNLIDRLVHLKMRRAKVARSFNYDVYPYC